jgi:DNA-binding transcriptional regulator YiaG
VFCPTHAAQPTQSAEAGYVSQLERGAKHPTGAALVLLDVIRRKGIEAIL